MTKEESELIIKEQDKNTKEILKVIEKEKCELLGIIQGKDKAIKDLEKKNAELDCQKNRNKFCYSCANATERCFKNEIGCPCGKYKSYKDENTELKGRECWKSCEYANPKSELIGQHIKDVQNLTKAKKFIKDLLGSENTSCEEEMFFEIRQKAKQFLKEE